MPPISRPARRKPFAAPLADLVGAAKTFDARVYYKLPDGG